MHRGVGNEESRGCGVTLDIIKNDRKIVEEILRVIGVEYPVRSLKIEWNPDMALTATIEYYPSLVKDVPSE